VSDRLDIDRLMREIRAEVGARLPTPGLGVESMVTVPAAPRTAAPLPRLGAFADDLAKQPRYRLADFLAYHDEDFVRQAYRRILGREPDREGASRYLAKIRAGALSRIEVLGRIRYSAEGRAAGVPISGLAAPFAMRSMRRVPVVGRLAGIAQYLWRLPDLARNHEALESAVFANRTELRAQVNNILDEFERRLATLASAAEVEALGGEVRSITAHGERLASRLADVERDKSSRGELETLRSDVRANATHADAAVQRVRSELHANVERGDARFDAIEGRVTSAFTRLDEGDRGRDDAAQRIAALLEDLVRTRRAVDALRDGNQALAQRVAQLPSLEDLAAARHRAEEVQGDTPPSGVPATSRQPAQAASPSVHDEGFYVAFEDRFRGTRDDIKQRVAIYLPIVRAAGAGIADAPLLDVGCGRGEWLELLREEQVQARGVDMNPVAVAGCQARGLDVVAADVLEYLHGLPDASLGAISAIHVIEHVPFARLVELFDEARRVLRPGGVAIFETPNPENLVVGACNFYFDPTHERPLPPEPFRFILESRGFERVEIMRLHPDTRAPDLSFLPAELAGVLAQRLFGPQDYALVGYRR
jgi:O-antigen chain-terminating methyltransferase